MPCSTANHSIDKGKIEENLARCYSSNLSSL